jgi:predicted dehydrogenase
VPIRVGVVGLGIGKTHLQHYAALEGVEIAAVADVNGAAAEALGSRYGARPFSDALEMMATARLDAVSICTPPRVHKELVVAAAERGLHVLCEKPMAPTVADCDAMIEAADRAGTTLMLGFKKRYAPAYQWLKEREPEWGRPHIAMARYQLGPVGKDWFWDEGDGGGPIIENTAHCIDILRYLLGEPTAAYAEISNFFSTTRQTDVAEAVFTLRFADATAAIAAGAAGVWAYDASERLSFSYDGAIAEVYGRFDLPRTIRVMGRSDADVSLKSWEDCSGWSGEFSAFVNCVRDIEKPRATGFDGKRALQIGLAIKQSGRTGQPVRIPEG